MSAVARRSPKLAVSYSNEDVRQAVDTLEERPTLPLKTPASASAPGFEGENCYDAHYFYAYRSGGWKRVALAAW